MMVTRRAAPPQPIGSSPKSNFVPKIDIRRERDRLVGLAKNLRKNATDLERKLWHDLKTIEGARFRRQVIIDRYIVDFACYTSRIIVELDGSQHADKAHALKDKSRDNYLRAQGFTVLRYWNFDTEHKRDGIIDAIIAHLSSRSPSTGELSSLCKTEGVIAPNLKEKTS